jgi:hypothetical protein
MIALRGRNTSACWAINGEYLWAYKATFLITPICGAHNVVGVNAYPVFFVFNVDMVSEMASVRVVAVMVHQYILMNCLFIFPLCSATI